MVVTTLAPLPAKPLLIRKGRRIVLINRTVKMQVGVSLQLSRKHLCAKAVQRRRAEDSNADGRPAKGGVSKDADFFILNPRQRGGRNVFVVHEIECG